MADTKPQILIVEDDQLLQNLLSRWLAKEDMDPIVAGNGEHALELIKEKKPQLVILDIILPGMSGFDVLAKIKENQDTKDIPVLILSNLGQEADIEKGKRLGAEEFIVKISLTVDEVAKLVKARLSRQHA